MSMRIMEITLLTVFMAMGSVNCLTNQGSDGSESAVACLLQSTFASSDLSLDSAPEVPKAAMLFESDALEETNTQSLMLRSLTRSRSCNAHLIYLNRKVHGLKPSKDVSDKKIDEVVKGFISKQSGSQDACSSQLMEAKHQLNQIHEYVSDLVVQVNHTERAILALDSDMQSQLKDMEALEKWLEKELAICEKKKKEYIEMYKKLSAEMEEMKQIASPGVAMDVKTGKVVTAETVGLVQMQNHSNVAKSLKKVQLLIKGTQSAAKQYATCMVHQAGRKGKVSQLQQSMAVDSIGDSEVSRKCSLGTYWCPLLDGAGISPSDQSKVTQQNGQWYYNGQSTKVGQGKHSESCDSAVVFCAGTGKKAGTFGWGKQQAAAVKAAIDNGGTHPNAPEPVDKREIDPAPPNMGDLGDNGEIKGDEGDFQSGSDFNGADMSIDSLRDENDQAAMDAAASITSGAASPEQCDAEKKKLEETYIKTYVELSRLKDEYNELANSTACFDNAESIYKSRKVPIQEKIDELIKDIDEKTRELQGLRPRLESATKAEKELRKHITTLNEECSQLPETVSNLDKVRDAIEALSKCPGLSRVQFSLPKWIGTWVEFKLKAKAMSDGEQDEAMDAACAEAVEGARAAEVGEIAEQSVEGIPETNTADLPLIGSCPHCQGDEASDFTSGHKRICWRQGKDLTPKAKSTNCASGKKALLCVTDRENIRQIPGE